MSRYFLLPLCFVACVSDPGTGGKVTGEEGGPCFENATCKGSLVCVVPNTCVKPDASTTMDGGGTDSMSSTDAPGDGTTMMDGAADGGPCLTGTIAHWEFEGSGAPKIGAVTLNDVGGVTYAGGGVKGKGATFNPGYFTTSTQAFGGLMNLSIEGWVKRTGTGNTQRLFYYADGNGGGTTLWSAYLDQNYSVVWTATNTTTSMPIPADGYFHHVALVFVGGMSGSVTAYIDGKQMNAVATGSIAAGSTNKLLVGADNGGSGVFGGTIDELAIYNRALDVNDVKAIIMAGPSGICRQP